MTTRKIGAIETYSISPAFQIVKYIADKKIIEPLIVIFPVCIEKYGDNVLPNALLLCFSSYAIIVFNIPRPIEEDVP